MLRIVLFAAMATACADYALVASGISQPFDDRVLLWVHAGTTPWLDGMFNVITDTGGVGRVVPVVVGAVFLLVTKRRLDAATFLGAAVVGQGLTYAVKALAQRDRPNLFSIANTPTDSSFPSGHALGSTIVYGLLAIWFWRSHRRAVAAFLCVWIALICFSRVYLGVHHPTDVIASISLGVALLAATALIHDGLQTGASA